MHYLAERLKQHALVGTCVETSKHSKSTLVTQRDVTRAGNHGDASDPNPQCWTAREHAASLSLSHPRMSHVVSVRGRCVCVAAAVDGDSGALISCRLLKHTDHEFRVSYNRGQVRVEIYL